MTHPVSYAPNETASTAARVSYCSHSSSDKVHQTYGTLNTASNAEVLAQTSHQETVYGLDKVMKPK